MTPQSFRALSVGRVRVVAAGLVLLIALIGGRPASLNAAEDRAAADLPPRAAPPQSAYLKAGEPAAYSNFGWSVAMEGDTLVVGAPFDSIGNPGDPVPVNPAVDAGVVYVFTRSAAGWSQQAELRAANGETYDWFGVSVAINGNTIVVGASREDSNGSDPADNSAMTAGAAYVFTREGGVWSQTAYLKASNAEADDNFGREVGVSGDTIVVGAYGEDSNGSGPDDNSAERAGAAYIFVRDGATWNQTSYLKAANAEAGDLFGRTVAIEGDTVVVGALSEAGNGSSPDDNSANGAGAVYVFARDGATWSQEAYLKASNAEAGDWFSVSLDISADTLVVGASLEDGNGSDQADNSTTDAGAAYVFVRGGTGWSQQAYLKGSAAIEYDNFGGAVAVSGDTVVVGAHFAEFYAGVAYLFRYDQTWSEEGILEASNPDSGDFFGNAVAVDGGTLVIGAAEEDGNGSSESDNSLMDAGAVYVFSEPLSEMIYLPYTANTGSLGLARSPGSRP